MAKNDNAGRGVIIQPGDLFEALALLTRIAVPATGERTVQSAWAWPLVGVIVGLFAAIVAWATLGFGLSGGTAAALAILTQIAVTGALHEDGLADCADGFWGGKDAKQRLEIMKDSRVGTYGVLALLLSLLLRWSLLETLFNHGYLFAPLIVAGLLSRSAMVTVMNQLENPRASGLSASIGQPDSSALAFAGASALLIAVLLSGFVALAAVINVVVLVAILSVIAENRIGGQTGDVLGASQQVGEIAALLAFAALLGS